VKLILCDQDTAVVEAWRAQFRERPEVEIRQGSLWEVQADGLVNPGNSFGFMDGGLALQIVERFGMDLEDGVRGAIREGFAGEILVGQAVVLPTGGNPPYLVYAPTTRTPQKAADSLNAYLATRAALAAVRTFNGIHGGEPIRSLILPGLCTGTAKMPPLVSARQIRYAYEEFQGLRKVKAKNLSLLARRESKLKRLPAAADAEEREEG